MTSRLPTLAFLREKLAQDQADLATQRASLGTVRHRIEDMKAEVIKRGGNSFDDADLEREVKADEQSYLQYLSRRELERVLDGTPTLSAALATPPTIPAPVHGRGVILLIALGLATAVSFPAALILTIWMLPRVCCSVRTSSDRRPSRVPRRCRPSISRRTCSHRKTPRRSSDFARKKPRGGHRSIGAAVWRWWSTALPMCASPPFVPFCGYKELRPGGAMA